MPGKTDKKLKVLADIWPAGQGYSGIPQETRLLFSVLCDLDSIEYTGMLGHCIKELFPGPRRNKKFRDSNIHKQIDQFSRHIVSYSEDPYTNLIERIIWKLRQQTQVLQLSAKTFMGVSQKLTQFEAKYFKDFLWRTYFAKTLPISDYENVTSSDFVVLSASWTDMNKVGLMSGIVGSRYPKVDTRGYDVFLAPTPWPGRTSPETQLVVHYQDAIPVFLPHVIPEMSFHQRHHYCSLVNSAKTGVFVCASEATRQDLLKLFPKIENKTTVINDIVSGSYFEDQGTPRQISEIIRSRIDPLTEPKFLMTQEKVAFYQQNLKPESLRYLMAVGTIEPRKNHLRLISAWENLRSTVDPDLKLILIGTLGWSNDKIMTAMKSWQERGQLFHLSAVPSPNLRLLYNNAAAVVAPSVAEGFDYSGVEAMLSGGVVAASDIPVHREVYGDACQYFNPYSTSQCARAIEELIASENESHRNTMVARGLKHAQKYQKENITPRWEAFFDRVRAGDFKKYNLERRVWGIGAKSPTDQESSNPPGEQQKLPRAAE